jgi:hypothetical protein
MIESSRETSFLFSLFDSPSINSSHRFQRQVIEAITVSSLGWLVLISLICGVGCALLIPDVKVKDNLQVGITTLTSSGAWVVSLIIGMAKEFITTLRDLVKLVPDLLSSVAGLLKSSLIQCGRWISSLKLQIFCFRPPGASHVGPKGFSFV